MSLAAFTQTQFNLAVRSNKGRWTPARLAKFKRACLANYIKEQIMTWYLHAFWAGAALIIVLAVVLLGSWWDEVEDFWKNYESEDEEYDEHA